MAVQDWSPIDAEIFHGFHTVGLGAINNALNSGILPQGYYALPEQHANRYIADILALHVDSPPSEPARLPTPTGGTAVADAPPRVRHKFTVETGLSSRRRSLAIRHVSGHRLIALLEIVSPGNKDREKHVTDFAAKVAAAVENGVHLLVIDLFPPGRHDPEGMHSAILDMLDTNVEPRLPPVDEPVTLSAYVAGPSVEVMMEFCAIGAALPNMPLFLSDERYVTVPLEKTYSASFEGFPKFWRDVLEGAS